jgi:hypothetical protein
MCDECEQAEPLAAVYLRKANRHGWRPPAAPRTAPRYRDDPGAAAPAATALACTAATEPLAPR